MHEPCTYDQDQMQALIDATRENGIKMDGIGLKIETLSNQHKDIIRWLLWVVCIIAVGSRALELAQGIWGKSISQVVAQEAIKGTDH